MNSASAYIPAKDRLREPFLGVSHRKQHVVAARSPLNPADCSARAQLGGAHDGPAAFLAGQHGQLDIERLAKPREITQTCQQRNAATAGFGRQLPRPRQSVGKIGGRWWTQWLIRRRAVLLLRSEEHTSELQSLMRISYDVF